MLKKFRIPALLLAGAMALVLLFTTACGSPGHDEEGLAAPSTTPSETPVPVPTSTGVPSQINEEGSETVVPASPTSAETAREASTLTATPALNEPGGQKEKGTPAPIPSTENADLVTREAEKMVALARSDLALRLRVPEEEAVVRSVEAVDWPDTSFGCPRPGMSYLQVVTPGFRLLFEVEGKTYEVHTDRGKDVVLCERVPSAETPSQGIDTNVEDGWPNQPRDSDVIVVPPTERKHSTGQ